MQISKTPFVEWKRECKSPTWRFSFFSSSIEISKILSCFLRKKTGHFIVISYKNPKKTKGNLTKQTKPYYSVKNWRKPDETDKKPNCTFSMSYYCRKKILKHGKCIIKMWQAVSERKRGKFYGIWLYINKICWYRNPFETDENYRNVSKTPRNSQNISKNPLSHQIVSETPWNTQNL